MKKNLLVVTLIVALKGFTQVPEESVTISGYAETYYSYDFNLPSDNTRPSFLYNFNRHNEFNLNLGYLKGSYSTARVRANLAIGMGTYINANYSAESGALKNIVEANVGYRLSDRKNLWLDIGIMPSHLGFESAIGKDNWTLTRSLAAENSPYFESGAKLSFTTCDNKLTISALALNGWQRITRQQGNSLLSWGTQISYKPVPFLSLNYSTFIGSDKPDSARAWRHYHNLYGIWQVNDKWGIAAGCDIGTERQKSWYTPVAILKFAPNSRWAIAYRAEYFKDKSGVIIATETPRGFAVAGNSLNIDHLPTECVMMRIEARLLLSKDEIFLKNKSMKAGNAAISFSTSVYF